MRRALEALDGVRPPVEVQYVSSRAWVRFDPARVAPEAMLAALRRRGYAPEVEGHLAGVRRAPGVTARAWIEPSAGPGTAATLVLRVAPDDGTTWRGDGGTVRLTGGAGIAFEGAAPEAPAELRAPWSARAALQMPAGGGAAGLLGVELPYRTDAEPGVPLRLELPVPSAAPGGSDSSGHGN